MYLCMYVFISLPHNLSFLSICIPLINFVIQNGNQRLLVNLLSLLVTGYSFALSFKLQASSLLKKHICLPFNVFAEVFIIDNILIRGQTPIFEIFFSYFDFLIIFLKNIFVSHTGWLPFLYHPSLGSFASRYQKHIFKKKTSDCCSLLEVQKTIISVLKSNHTLVPSKLKDHVFPDH